MPDPFSLGEESKKAALGFRWSGLTQKPRVHAGIINTNLTRDLASNTRLWWADLRRPKEAESIYHTGSNNTHKCEAVQFSDDPFFLVLLPPFG
jgi:hypothetical protein